MLYHLVKPVGRIGIALFYRKVFLVNEDHIPADKPVIIASNHPTAFIEPTLLGCWLKRELHFIVRGDLFTHPIYRRMLLDLNMIPIYRRIDVKEHGDLKKNFDTLDYCYDLLGKGELIHILAEGNTIQEKRLRPIQKGTARMAFGAIEKHGEDLDIYIIPTGVNYTQADQPRTDVMFDFGVPIRIQDYMDSYRQNKNKAIRELTRDLTTQLQPRLITIDKVEDEPLTEGLFTIYRNNFPEKIWPITERTATRMEGEKRTGNYVNQLEEESKVVLAQQVNTYFADLDRNDINDFAVKYPSYGNLRNTLFALFGWMPHAIGYALNYFPIGIGQNIVRNKIKQREFKAPVLLAVCLGGFLLYYIGLLLAGLLVGKLWFWAIVLGIPLLGYVALLYRDFYPNWRAAKRYNRLDHTAQLSLQEQRKAITDLHFWE